MPFCNLAGYLFVTDNIVKFVLGSTLIYTINVDLVTNSSLLNIVNIDDYINIHYVCLVSYNIRVES